MNASKKRTLMSSPRQHGQRREGSALLIALLALAGLSIIGLSLMLVTDTELQVSNDERLRKQALYAAEAGIEHALVYVRGLEPKAFGMAAPPSGQLGLLSGSTANDSPTDPPDELQSYNDTIVVNENLFNPAKPWKAPALARKGQVLYFCTTCTSPTWFKTGFPKPTINYSMRDIPFEESAGAGGAWEVGTFKSRYTVYVKNNQDDPILFGTDPNKFIKDSDQKVVLTADGIVDVLAGATGRGGVGGEGYKVVRTVEVTVKTGGKKVCIQSVSAGGVGGSGGSMGHCDETAVLQTAPGGTGTVRNQNWQ